MKKFLLGFFLITMVSFYVFPISFTFLPQAVNSKILVAVFGVFAFTFESIRKKAMRFPEPIIFSALLAALFSVWCLYSVIAANTYDMVYATYIISYLTWIFGAYGVYGALRLAYDNVDLEILTRYLALVGVAQCIAAVVIDNNAAFASFVDRFVDMGQEFFKRGNRLYGIGAALDPAGIRFSVILIMIAHQFSTNPNVRQHRLYQATDLGAFAIIVIIGSVISRTTLVGTGLGLFYIIISIIRMRKGGFMTISMVKMFFWFFVVMMIIVGVSIYFYRASDTFQGYLRFGFEAFFNWVETGEFRTSSTDTLNDVMWIWPDNLRDWLVGRGTYGIFDNGTDIGYCNFTLYCGLIGLLIFSIFFIYCHTVQIRKFQQFKFTAWLLVALTFIVWVKVATDIFFIDALLFCIASDYEGEVEDVTYADHIVPDDISVRK